MKKYIVAIILTLSACADTEIRQLKDTNTDTYCTLLDGTVTCPDGSSLTITEPRDEISYISTNIAHNSCSPVSNGLFVESIHNSEFFDVYKDKSCQDRVNGQLNEVCDNVEPSYGATGQFGSNKAGASEVCVYNNLLIFGIRNSEYLTINILEVL